MYVIKKDGTREEFNVDKIIAAVNKSAARILYEFSTDEIAFICQFAYDRAESLKKDGITIQEMHNIVEGALERVNPAVAKSYRDYRNYKLDFIHMMDEVYTKSQSIRYIGDKSNANTDSALVATKRSLIFNELNKELYRKFFMTRDELQACKDGYIYIHDQSARLDTMNCCLFDVAAAGCVVNNCDTIHAIYEAVHFGRPVMKKVMTITGNAIKEPQNLRVRTGTNFRELIEEAGGFTSEPEKIIAGGPMMGIPLISLDVPVVKTSSAILCMTKDEVAACEETACINCGRCVSVCPGRIIPAKLADYAKRHDKESFEKANGMECCECGCCSYICPAKRPLTQYIKSMRKMVLADRKKAAQRGNGK